MSKEYLLLKWGTLKGWNFNEGSKAHKAFKKYAELGTSLGAMSQEDTAEQKKLICEMIDAIDAKKIQNDWSGDWMTKEEAKDYVLNYDKE